MDTFTLVAAAFGIFVLIVFIGHFREALKERNFYREIYSKASQDAGKSQPNEDEHQENRTLNRKKTIYRPPTPDGLIDVVIELERSDGSFITFDGLRDGIYGYNVMYDSMTVIIQFGMYIETYSGLNYIRIKDRHHHV